MLAEKLELGEKVSSEVVCSKCGVTTTTDKCNCFEGKKGEDIYLCEECTKIAEKQLAEQTKNPNYVLAFLLGLVFASLGSAVWIAIGYATNYEIGYIAILIGILAGKGVVIGSGNKKGSGLQIMSLIIALFAILVAKYVTLMLYWNEALETQRFLWASPFNFDLITASFSPISIVILVFGVLAAYNLPKAPRL